MFQSRLNPQVCAHLGPRSLQPTRASSENEAIPRLRGDDDIFFKGGNN